VIGPDVRVRKDGSVSIVGLQPAFVAALMDLPQALQDDGNEKVRRRLYPEPSEDRAQQEEWARFVRPELFALVASAREIVSKDLARLSRAKGRQAVWNLKIPARHVSAWMSALQAARLALGARHDIGEAEMEGRVTALDETRQLALAKIHILAWIQELLIEATEERD
jgi:hypothetical protein